MKEKILKIIKLVATAFVIFAWLGSCASYNGELKKTKELQAQIEDDQAKIEELNKTIAELEAKNKETSEKLIAEYDKNMQNVVNNFTNSTEGLTNKATDLIENTDFSTDYLYQQSYKCPSSDDVIDVSVFKTFGSTVNEVEIIYRPSQEESIDVYECKLTCFASHIAFKVFSNEIGNVNYLFGATGESYCEHVLTNLKSENSYFYNRDGSKTLETPDWVNEATAKMDSNKTDTVTWVFDTMDQIWLDIDEYLK